MASTLQEVLNRAQALMHGQRFDDAEAVLRQALVAYESPGVVGIGSTVG